MKEPYHKIYLTKLKKEQEREAKKRKEERQRIRFEEEEEAEAALLAEMHSKRAGGTSTEPDSPLSPHSHKQLHDHPPLAGD